MSSCPLTSSGADRRRVLLGSFAVLGLSLLVGGLALLGVVTLGACGGTGSTASSSASTEAAVPSASPSVVHAEEPVSQWDAPGTASTARTQAVTRRYAAALHAEKIPDVKLYAPDATWDVWSSEEHREGAPAIAKVYRDVASECDWSKSHVMVAPGVGVDEGVFTVYGTTPTPFVSLLALDGNKIAHEEIFLNDGRGRPVTFYGTAPGTNDSAMAAARVGTAVAEAFAAGDEVALQELLAPDVVFYDTTQGRGARGTAAVDAWWAAVPDAVSFVNKKPLSGSGWAVLRWTARRVYSTGVELAMPGATVLEVRDGKVVRMTLYYNSKKVSLQL
jgi:ketosteroid isomerase-like protein